MTTKICSKCKQKLTLDHFCKNKKKKDGLQTFCKQCNKAYLKKYYADDKQAQFDRNSRYKQKLRKAFQQYKAKQQCVFCGEKTPCCLDFHHIDPSQKDFTISNAIDTKAKDILWQEVEKCIVVCANCHRKLHNGLLDIGSVA